MRFSNETTPDGRVKVALVGGGKQGKRVHLTRAVAHRLVAVVDLDGALAHRLAQPYGARGFTDYDKAFAATRPDVVIIATHASSHAAIIEAAARHGVKVVLCEKPPTDSVASARRIAALVRAGLLQVVYGFKYQYAIPPQVLEFIRADGLGVLQKVEGTWQRFDGLPKRNDAAGASLAGDGAWDDLASHLAAVELTLAGFPSIRSVEAQALSYVGGEWVRWDPARSSDHWTTAAFRVDGGARITAEVAWKCPVAPREEKVEVRAIFSKGMFTQPLPILGSDPERMRPRLELWTPGDAPDLTTWQPPDDAGLYDAQWAHVLEVLRGDAEPSVGAEAGVAIQEFLDLGYASAAGRELSVRS
jgi:predicted dehydrogenase